jgi:thioredoxin reductase
MPFRGYLSALQNRRRSKRSAYRVEGVVRRLRFTAPRSEVCAFPTPFVVKTEVDEYTARAVIIATGASACWLGLPGEQCLLGRGVSVCATCDGFFFRGKEVVVGGGDTAMEETLFLTQFARQVTLLHRRATFRASAILLEQVQRHPKIRILPEREVVNLLGEENVVGVRVRHTATGEEQSRASFSLLVIIPIRTFFRECSASIQPDISFPVQRP